MAKANGWVEIYRNLGCFKRVFQKDGFILKFDAEMDYSKDKNGWHSHTASEWRSWLRSPKARRRYIVPSIAYHRGVLIQPFLSNANRPYLENYQLPDKIRKIVNRFRFSHSWHYGYLNGRLKFYDTDSLGSGWWSWKRVR